MNDVKLLRGFVRSVIKENNPYTSSGFDALKIFADPLKDILISSGEIFEKSIPITKMVIGVTLGVLKNQIPGLQANFENTFTKFNGEIDRINSKYEDVLFKTFSNPDVAAATFLWNPALFIAGVASIKGSRAPQEFLNKIGSVHNVPNRINDYLDKSGDRLISAEYRDKISRDAKKNVAGLQKLQLNIDAVLRGMKKKGEFNDQQLTQLKRSLTGAAEKLEGGVDPKILKEKYLDDLVKQRKEIVKVLKEANVDVKRHGMVSMLDEIIEQLGSV